jgi:hypothetical protein
MTIVSGKVGQRLLRSVDVLALLLPALVLLAHAGLWPQGRWHDEYFTFYVFQLAGVRGELIRLWQWVPRPFSEFLIFSYWLGVRATGVPMIAQALAAAWAILIIGFLAVARPWAKPGSVARCALVLGPPALFLLAAPVGELFYWPFASLAYLPALAAASYSTVALAGPGLRERSDWVALAAALSLGAASVEMGTFLALCIAPGLLLAAATGKGGASRLRLAAALAPLLTALTIMTMLLHGRVSRSAEMFGDASIYHNITLSLWLGAGDCIHEFLCPDGSTVFAAAAVKLLVFLGVRECVARIWPATPARGPIFALLVGLAGAAFLSAVGAYFNFGKLCCERHAAYRQALFLLMPVAIAGLWRPSRNRGLGPVLLALAVLILLPSRLPALRAEYALAHLRGAALKTTFRSGRQPGSAPLDYVIPPTGPLLNFAMLTPGYYQMKQNPPPNIEGPMLFFGKSSMIIRKMEEQ